MAQAVFAAGATTPDVGRRLVGLVEKRQGLGVTSQPSQRLRQIQQHRFPRGLLRRQTQSCPVVLNGFSIATVSLVDGSQNAVGAIVLWREFRDLSQLGDRQVVRTIIGIDNCQPAMSGEVIRGKGEGLLQNIDGRFVSIHPGKRFARQCQRVDSGGGVHGTTVEFLEGGLGIEAGQKDRTAQQMNLGFIPRIASQDLHLAVHGGDIAFLQGHQAASKTGGRIVSPPDRSAGDDDQQANYSAHDRPGEAFSQRNSWIVTRKGHGPWYG